MTEQKKALYKFLTQMAPVSQEFFETLSEAFTFASFNQGDYLVKQGDFVRDIFFITEGLVRSYYLTKEGHIRIKCFYAENSVVAPLNSLISGLPSNLNISCIEATKVLKAPFKLIRQLNNVDLNLQICARTIAEREFISKDKREFQFLTMKSKEQYQEFLKDYPGISKRISDRQIADYIGIRKETLSRLKNNSVNTIE